MIRKLFPILFLLCFFSCVYAKDARTLSVAERNAAQGFNDTIDRTADDFVEAYVAVAEPGDYLYSTFGHAAFHLKCPKFDLDYYYTMESEGNKDNTLQFLAGNLKMGLFYLPAEEFTRTYAEENRGIKEWKLNLTPLQKQRLWALLDKYVKEWQDIPYDYYHRGCAITMVDIMNELIGKENIHYSESWPANLHGTVRETGYYALQGQNEWAQFWMCIMVGNEIDKKLPNERLLYVPMDLVEAWQNATIDGHALLDSKTLETLPTGERKKTTYLTPFALSIILLILALMSFGTLFINAQWARSCGTIVDYIILSVVTLIGIFMTYLLYVSKLPCTDWNWLYIAFNPLPAVFWHWRKYWAFPYAVLMLGWVVAMICAPHLLSLWSHMLIICAFAIILMKEKKLNNKKI